MIGLRSLAAALMLLIGASADDGIHIATQSGLDAAIAAARPGAKLRLAAGTEFQTLAIRDRRGAPLEITSEDPARPATIRNMVIDNSTDITLTGLRLLAANDRIWYHFTIAGSERIRLSAMRFDGPGMDAAQDTTGLLVRRSRDVSITRSRASNLTFALAFLDSSDIAVADTRFTDLRSDGVRGGGNSRVKVTGNFFTNFHPNTARDDHPDAIQFWTVATTTSATDYEISGNVVIRGATGAPIQGVFLKDEVGTLPYERISITGNIVLGGSYNAIAVDGAGIGVLSGNLVQAFPDQQSWIRTQNATERLAVNGNSASDYITQFPPDRSNRGIGATRDKGRKALQGWRTAHQPPAGFASWDELAQAAGLDLTEPR